MAVERFTLVTGGTGFIGSAVVRRLVEAGHRVRALVRPGSDRRNLEGLPVEIAHGDLRDRTSLAAALKGCAQLYHAAALYALWVPDRRLLYQVNVGGTRNLMEAAGEAGVERVVYTSTVGTLGLRADGQPADEETPVSLGEIHGDYKRAKFAAEAEVRRLAQAGLPVVIVNPSAPVGPRDIKPTPTGQMIVDFLNGKMWAYLDTGLNLIAVEDVADGHLLAAERGRIGERYILGHEDMTLLQIFQALERISGVPAPRWRAPRAAILPLAFVSQAIADHVTKRSPLIPLDAVRMAKRYMFFDSGKAVRELGLPQRPVEAALERAVRWFTDNGYVAGRR